MSTAVTIGVQLTRVFSGSVAPLIGTLIYSETTGQDLAEVDAADLRLPTAAAE